ncbi:glucosamine-6-phosphate deaminase (macronuclear) [Tetrahymena thermophila SB210]|uniref:Glucosamine-6-phosphate deaminase n=2 Tax=Tetrahymena thermophila TaxID=5911 RepID=Q246C5_TETTS|nr:glucosamine-6-phosphate deaminase [Tetrahymena thermophila SB210]EAS03458.3 glucosamine-6-phosphate deaminase [Tetrahymena thermophila SB210]|eukprot:XP_001023703.3 glucosamine-6-phosphate deaminase [Tetrahymena thermophila SB210]
MSKNNYSYIDTDPLFRSKEKIPSVITVAPIQSSLMVAREIRDLILKTQKEGINCVLGLATGSTPVAVYKELIRMHKEEGLSFKNVITFNLDEYYPIPKEHNQSYNFFMRDRLFNHIDIPAENINIPDGTIPKESVLKFCEDYEAKIESVGGIDFQLLGIGRTGHIGFNEPGSSLLSKTRIINLDKKTRMDAASDFMGLQHVPKYAITMGVSSVMKAKKIAIMGFSETKAPIIASTIEGPVTSECPATFLQTHPNCTFYMDLAAAEKLTRHVAPWTIKGVNSDPDMIYDDYWAKKAVIWLSQKVNKPILSLIESDYEDNDLLELLNQVGNGHAGKVNLQVFRQLQSTITGWPAGGRPDESTNDYFNQKAKVSKKILVFSPHPDDDVICMGGTMEKLVNQGHDVHVAYQTSGNIAVFDHDASRFNDFFREFLLSFAPGKYQELIDLTNSIDDQIDNRKIGEYDTLDNLKVKGLIRRVEARSAAISTGVKKQNIYSLDLPFYETGTIKKDPMGPKDVKIVKELITRVQPELIYAAGDLTDPHGTHRVCLQIILAALDELNAENHPIMEKLQVLLYRGAWQEWEIENIHISCPLSPEEMERKKFAIFRHQSQKDSAMFPGADKREFWQRAQDRNIKTANLYRSLGLTYFEGLECFVSLEWLKTQMKI